MKCRKVSMKYKELSWSISEVPVTSHWSTNEAHAPKVSLFPSWVFRRLSVLLPNIGPIYMPCPVLPWGQQNRAGQKKCPVTICGSERSRTNLYLQWLYWIGQWKSWTKIFSHFYNIGFLFRVMVYEKDFFSFWIKCCHKNRKQMSDKSWNE
jgi:hypothetical protein